MPLLAERPWASSNPSLPRCPLFRVHECPAVFASRLLVQEAAVTVTQALTPRRHPHPQPQPPGTLTCVVPDDTRAHTTSPPRGATRHPHPQPPGTLTWVVPDEGLVQVGQLVGRDVPAGVIGRLEVQVILARPVELRGSYVHADDDLVAVASLADGILQQLQGWKEMVVTTLETRPALPSGNRNREDKVLWPQPPVSRFQEPFYVLGQETFAQGHKCMAKLETDSQRLFDRQMLPNLAPKNSCAGQDTVTVTSGDQLSRRMGFK